MSTCIARKCNLPKYASFPCFFAHIICNVLFYLYIPNLNYLVYCVCMNYNFKENILTNTYSLQRHIVDDMNFICKLDFLNKSSSTTSLEQERDVKMRPYFCQSQPHKFNQNVFQIISGKNIFWGRYGSRAIRCLCIHQPM